MPPQIRSPEVRNGFTVHHQAPSLVPFVSGSSLQPCFPLLTQAPLLCNLVLVLIFVSSLQVLWHLLYTILQSEISASQFHNPCSESLIGWAHSMGWFPSEQDLVCSFRTSWESEKIGSVGVTFSTEWRTSGGNLQGHNFYWHLQIYPINLI